MIPTDPNRRHAEIGMRQAGEVTRAKRRDRERGMTLLELIVALTLVSLVCAAIASALKLGMGYVNRREKISGSQTDIALTQGALRRLLEGARPLTIKTQDGARRGVFSGGADGLACAVALPNDFGLGGMYEMTLAARETNGKKRFVALFRPFPPREADHLGDQETVLIEDIKTVSFRYLAPRAGSQPPVWRPDWPSEQTAPPRLVSVSVAFKEDDARRWPELVAAPRLGEAGPP